MRHLPVRLLALLCFCCLRLFGQTDWYSVGGDSGGQRFGHSRQITRANLNGVEPLWTFHTHALDHPRMGKDAASFESTPVLYKRSLIVTDPFDHVFAVDPTSGKQLWDFDPKPQLLGEGNLTTNRGVAIYRGKGDGHCSSRIFVGTLDGFVYAIDADTGKACTDFGASGRADIKLDVGRTSPAEVYEITSAPLVIGDTVIVGSSIPDSQRVNELRGTVHAFDVHSGKVKWTWDPIGTWAMQQPKGQRTGAGNVWSSMSSDPALGLVYLPTGSASPDHYGGMRLGDDRDANSIVALDGNTGKRVWGFQLVHHDVWDYDVAAPPVLFDYRGTPAIAVAAKPGIVFVLNRRTGEPLVPVDERPVAQSDIPGEQLSPTQPFSRLPAMSPIQLSDSGQDFRGATDRDQQCADVFAGKRYDGLYTPPSLRGSIIYPGAVGGVNWGGFAFDPVHQVLYANVNNDVFGLELITRDEFQRRFAMPRTEWLIRFVARRTANLALNGVLAVLFAGLCVFFWRHNRRLTLASAAIAGLALCAIPAHPLLEYAAAKRVRSLPHYGVNASREDDYSPQTGSPYSMHRRPITDKDGNPCTKLPWGRLVALNLNTGTIQFSTVHGPDTNGQPTGSISVGGPIVTAGGLVFSAGTKAHTLFVYDATTGERLRALDLPGPAQAVPMTYEMNGKQYVVIAVGGHGPLGMLQGDSLMAFGLK